MNLEVYRKRWLSYKFIIINTEIDVSMWGQQREEDTQQSEMGRTTLCLILVR